jgi:hypothetical protein
MSLLKLLNDVKFFELVSDYCQVNVVSIDDLPENERELLNALGVTPEDSPRFEQQFKAILETRNYRKVFDTCRQQLETLEDSYPATSQTRGRRIITALVGTTQVLVVCR